MLTTGTVSIMFGRNPVSALLVLKMGFKEEC
jgi:hypothetical protein